jgi:hypothetical protein
MAETFLLMSQEWEPPIIFCTPKHLSPISYHVLWLIFAKDVWCDRNICCPILYFTIVGHTYKECLHLTGHKNKWFSEMNCALITVADCIYLTHVSAWLSVGSFICSLYLYYSVECEDMQIGSRSAWPCRWGVCCRLVTWWVESCQWRQRQAVETVSSMFLSSELKELTKSSTLI